VLRETFGLEREEVTVDGRRPHTENLKNLYSLTKYHLGDQIQKSEMCDKLAPMGEGGGAYRTLLGMSEGRRPL